MQAFEHPPAGLVRLLNGGAAARRALVEHADTHAVAFTGKRAGCAGCRSGRAALPPVADRGLGQRTRSSSCRRRRSTSSPAVTAFAASQLRPGLHLGRALHVHEDVYARFVEALREAGAERCAWAAASAAVDLGPMASAREARTRRGRRRARGRAGRAHRSVAGGGHPHSGAAGSTSRPCSRGPARDGDHARRVFRPAGAGVPRRQPGRGDRARQRLRDGPGANLYTQDLAEAMRAVHRDRIRHRLGQHAAERQRRGALRRPQAQPAAGANWASRAWSSSACSKMAMIAPRAEADLGVVPYPDGRRAWRRPAERGPLLCDSERARARTKSSPVLAEEHRAVDETVGAEHAARDRLLGVRLQPAPDLGSAARAAMRSGSKLPASARRQAPADRRRLCGSRHMAWKITSR